MNRYKITRQGRTGPTSHVVEGDDAADRWRAQGAIVERSHATGTLAAKLLDEAALLRQYDRMVASGSIDPDCATCQTYYGTLPFVHPDAFAPRHRASDRCRSGKRPHCTCDTCF